MAALINMAMLYHPLPFVAGKKQQKQHLDYLPVFPIESATPSESPFLPNIRRRLVSQRTPKEPFGSFFSTPPWFRWTPLSRGSGGRFGVRRFRAKQNPNAFVTHRAFTRTLPPSQASVQFLSPFRLFLSAGAQVKDKNRPVTAERKKQ